MRPTAFYGSSSIRLWTTLAADLEQPGTLNLGFGGSTLADCARHFGRLVAPRRPRSLVVYAGDNDLGVGRAPDEILASFRDLVGQVDARLGPIPFAFLSIKPSPERWALDDAIRATNDAIRAELAPRPGSTYVDIHSPMLGPDGRPRAGLYAFDGLHLSPEGYRLWAGVLLRHREAIFP